MQKVPDLAGTLQSGTTGTGKLDPELKKTGFPELPEPEPELFPSLIQRLWLR